MKTIPFWGFALLGFSVSGFSQSAASETSAILKVGRMLDVRKGNYVANAGIWIEGARIKAVGGLLQAH